MPATHKAKGSDQLDVWRLAEVRADLDCGPDEFGERDARRGDLSAAPLTRVRRVFNRWFKSAERVKAALADPHAPGAAEILKTADLGVRQGDDLIDRLEIAAEYTGRALESRGRVTVLKKVRREVRARHADWKRRRRQLERHKHAHRLELAMGWMKSVCKIFDESYSLTRAERVKVVEFFSGLMLGTEGK